MSLRFRFGATQNEIEHFQRLAEPFLISPHVLQAWLAKLRWLEKQRAGTATSWVISRDDPIVTHLSPGKYHPGNNGPLTVYGTISSKWDIRSCRNDRRLFEIVDNASTTVSVFRSHLNELIGSWNFDIGTVGSPGCHFHAQMPGLDALGLDVPRLPIPFIIPLDALDFLLGELFQNDWQQQSTKRNDAFQRMRMIEMFEWSKRAIEGSHAAWMQLKRAKPPATLLVA